MFFASIEPPKNPGMWWRIFVGDDESPGILIFLVRFVINLGTDLVNNLINGFLEKLPVFSGIDQDLTPLMAWVTAVNHWFPLDYLFLMLSGYLVFLVAFIGIKLVIKAIPTVG